MERASGGAAANGTAASALELAHWRRAVGELYREVRVEPDPVRAHARWRARRDELYASHPQSPLPPDGARRGARLAYFEYDPAFRFVAPIRPLEGLVEHRVETDEGELTRLVPLGIVELGPPISAALVVYALGQYGGGLFLPFRDASGESATYGGGRYLLDTAKGADLGEIDGRLVLDFNFAYHPSCAYDPRWRCPLAPIENRLAAFVAAGERLH